MVCAGSRCAARVFSVLFICFTRPLGDWDCNFIHAIFVFLGSERGCLFSAFRRESVGDESVWLNKGNLLKR